MYIFVMLSTEQLTQSMTALSNSLQSCAANDATHVTAARRPWPSSVSVRERRRNCLWGTMSHVVSVVRAVFMTSQLTITSMCYCVYMLWLSS